MTDFQPSSSIETVPAENAEVAREPLTDSKLIAQVADNALGENIVHEIATRGLAFKPDGAQAGNCTAAETMRI